MMASAVQAKTSTTHPITLSWVDAEGDAGRVGLCYCPGKVVRKPERGVLIERDVRLDLQRLRGHFGISVVVCLLDKYELRT